MRLALIEGLRQIVSLYDYCEAHGLINDIESKKYNLNEDGEFDNGVDDNELNWAFTDLWVLKLQNEIKDLDNTSWDDALCETSITLPDGGVIAVQCYFDDALCFGEHDTIRIRYDEIKAGRNLTSQMADVLNSSPKDNPSWTALFEIETERADTFNVLVDAITKLSEIANESEQKMNS